MPEQTKQELLELAARVEALGKAVFGPAPPIPFTVTTTPIKAKAETL